MRKMIRSRLVLATVAALAGFASAGLAGPYLPYTDPTGQVQPDQILAWATSVVDYLPAPGVTDAWDDSSNALGPSGGGTVSLGDLDTNQIADKVAPGSITVKFSTPIVDKAGPDLAVFENAGTFFGGPFVFAELAFVQVSSNGSDFVQFPATSLNTGPVANPNFDDTEPESFPNNTRYLPVAHEPGINNIDAYFGRNFSGVNTTNIKNLAGVHPAGIGTPFDLAELAGLPEVVSGAVDLSAIRYVRLVDIPGDGSFLDNDNHPIFDTWLTVDSGGFDLDAVGAINVPELPTSLLALLGLAMLVTVRRPRR